MNIKDADLRAQALVFYEADIQAIDSILEAFLKKSAARCALLVDQDGHMITAAGDTERVDLDTISALVAGSFAATKALAHTRAIVRTNRLADTEKNAAYW